MWSLKMMFDVQSWSRTENLYSVNASHTQNKSLWDEIRLKYLIMRLNEFNENVIWTKKQINEF